MAFHPMVAAAQPVEIATLGESPLIGRIASADGLQHHAGRLEQAGRALDLTPQQSAQLAQALAASSEKPVIGPRHLDAMTWSLAPAKQVRVLHDIIIPAAQPGWEIDVDGASLYIPKACGNLSLVRRPGQRATLPHPARVVAGAPVPASSPRAPVLAAPAPPVGPPNPTIIVLTPAPSAETVPDETPSAPIDAADAQPPATTLQAETPQSGHRRLGWFIVPFIAGFIDSARHSSGGGLFSDTPSSACR